MNHSPTRLLLNVSPVAFNPSWLNAEQSPYQSPEHLREVRQRHAATHVAFRISNDLIIAPATVDATPTGLGAAHTIDLSSDVRTGARVVRHALVSYFHGLGRTLLDFDPVVFIAAGSKDDLIGQAAPYWKTRPQWLKIAPRYTLDVRGIEAGGVPRVAITVDVESTIRIDAPCAALIAAGISPLGWYVSQLSHVIDPRVQPRRRLLGRIAAVDGSTLHLTDTREGDVTVVDAASVYPEPRRETLHAIVAALAGDRVQQVLNGIDTAMRRFHHGPERLARLRALMQHIAKNTFRVGPVVTFTIDSFLAEGSPEFPPVERAPRPTYVFDPATRKTDTWNDRGLKQYGPYTAKSFSPSRPRVAVICQNRFQGVVEQVVFKLLHGVSSAAGDGAPFEQGFIRKYALQDFSAEFFAAADHTVASYDRASRQALAAAGQQNAKWDLVLVQTEGRFRDFYGAENPYLVTKATFLGAQTPVQSFKIETVDVPDRQLGYVLNNIALAAYAKMGGVPWLLQANPTIAHEVVIGLGSAELSSTRLGVKQRMVGVTTVFTGDGRYHLSSVSQAAPFDEYPEAVLASLRGSISSVRSDFNWQKGERVRVVFHAFKDFRNVEAEAVKRVMRELVDFEVEYAFLHVADTHPFLLFDESQHGVPAPGGAKKGVLAPERSLFLPLAADKTLLVLTGPRDVKLAGHGLPRPILLKLHGASTFTDMRYLARQVATFAAHSWRSFSPSAMPVTILYSELVARLLPQLTAVDPGLATALLGRIGRTRWFL